MSQICRANPCCGNFYGDCEIPLPPAAQEPSEGRAGDMTPDRAIYFLERFKREEKMLGPNEQWALEFAIAALSPPANSHVPGWQPIETAPLDKTNVIIAVPTKDRDDWIVGEAYFDPEHHDDGDWWWAGTSWGDYHGGPVSELNYHGPSHWMPLPAPPALVTTEASDA